jgi:type IV pilus biogenesis protein CpaD/CtpE
MKQPYGCSIQDGLAYFMADRLASLRPRQKKPKPAWNEDYLLGQWHDTAPRSPAAVEAQLRVILRGVDLMVDRATFKLAKTSYRSQCWLNTY